MAAVCAKMLKHHPNTLSKTINTEGYLRFCSDVSNFFFDRPLALGEFLFWPVLDTTRKISKDQIWFHFKALSTVIRILKLFQKIFIVWKNWFVHIEALPYLIWTSNINSKNLSLFQHNLFFSFVSFILLHFQLILGIINYNFSVFHVI